MAKRYTEFQLDYLRVNYKLYGVSELTKAFNKEFGTCATEVGMYSLLAYHEIRCGRAPKMPKKRAPKYTQEQLEFLKRNYPSMKTHELTQAFNEKFNQRRTVSAIISQLTLKGLRGKRDKGMPSSVRRAVGSERLCPNSGFIVIKTDEEYPRKGGICRRRHKHKVVWEQCKGPIPPGHTIRFLDGNKQNCHIENLLLFTRAENFHLNLMGFDQAPSELKESIILRARLIGKIAERRRELDNR